MQGEDPKEFKADSQLSLKRRTTLPMVTEDVTKKVFTLFQSHPSNQRISLDKLLDALQAEGLRLTDPRLKNFMSRVERLPSKEVDEVSLQRVMGYDIQLIATTLKQMLIIPDFPAFTKHVEEIYHECKSNEDGHVATYIPILARVDPKYWGCSVCTVDGQRFSLGDSLIPFSLQSCCKPLSYALALRSLGKDAVHEFVGQEPSGRPFNSLVLDSLDKPYNPMINPGAIVTCAILRTHAFQEMTVDEMTSTLMQFIEEMASGEFINYNDEVFESEKETGYRNNAIAYLMKEKHWFPDITVDDVLTFYFKTCSIEVNCETLSVIAATLANGGMCPLTNNIVIKQDVVRCVLSLMQSCGMYDYSGQFAFLIGLPAKSGVSGGVMLVVPSVMGIALWSPCIDVNGNSCRGLQFCKTLLNYYCLHPYSFLGHADPEQEDVTKRPNRQKEVNVMRILFAASKGDTDALRCYYMRNLSMEMVDYDSRTALHLAAAGGHLESVRFLVEVCRVTVDPIDRFGRTPLKDAEDFAQDDVATYLRCVCDLNL